MSIQFLCKQNIALRGDIDERSNFLQLMNLITFLCPSNHTLPSNYLSGQMQNELMQLMAEDVKQRNISMVKKNGHYGVSADETSDVQNNSIFSLTCRTVNNELDVQEVFSGMHIVPNKKSETLANLIAVSMLTLW